jgi:glutamine cyclotransferase
MLSTLIRYEGWFLLVFSTLLIAIEVFRRKGYKVTEGVILFFATLAGFGIGLWLLWNLLIFKDPLYFIFGPYSAYVQQEQLASAGNLITKGNLLASIKIYLYALAYNSNTFILILGTFGAVVFWMDKKISTSIKIAASALFAPLIFNILALYLGQSVLFIQGLSGNTWFNARYGIMMMPSLAIFIGYLVYRADKLKYVLIGLMAFVLFFSFANSDAVTIDDARVGSSQKNVSEVSGWLRQNAQEDGFILISAASHDAIIFSSGLQMSKFIHEGTGAYWDSATTAPDRWARWIVMRTNDINDSTFKLVSKTKAYRDGDYNLVNHYPFADIYEIKPELVKDLNTKPILGKQK